MKDIPKKSDPAGEPAPITFELALPLDEEGVKLSSLTIRAPRARDVAAAKRQAPHASEVEFHLFASLCEVSPAAISALHMADYFTLQEKFAVFFGGLDADLAQLF